MTHFRWTIVFMFVATTSLLPLGTGCDVGCLEGESCGGDCPTGKTSCSGVCVSVASDPANCGSCGMACPSGRSCQSGVCACPDPTSDCSGTCVDTATDVDNCGACGNACDSSQTCSDGACS